MNNTQPVIDQRDKPTLEGGSRVGIPKHHEKGLLSPGARINTTASRAKFLRVAVAIKGL